ncbi:MAG: ABC transporter permease [Bacteroidales bacterium]|nr:ABC transporter permease [Bacteroidales bacterium]MDD2264956.1 ABC transporter permease [Bacteroidales bacterium]MDD2832124.1 ABC transporter permease [Bacteroidales bacterium]MDD3208776.1 ABC transporter permease [Bacteroidales bacterium]MDD3697339.1 ABC transporter permease [Bacteroidales bacterium]
MKKFRYLIYKDYLLLKRDVAGLLLMFLMPVILVILMTLLQQSTFQAITDASVPLLLVNNDQGKLGGTIDKEIESSGIFRVDRQIKGKTPSLEELEKEVASSRYTLGIYIPENTTVDIQKNVARYVLSAFSGEEKLPALDRVELIIFVDPTTKASFYTAIMSTLKERTQKIEFAYILKEITRQVNDISPIPISTAGFSGEQVYIDIRDARLEGKNLVPTPVQHNVPAWSLFAVFFIVISLSGSIIRERQDGSFSRLLTMPCSYTEYLLSKAIVFTVVALIQFVLIFLIGVFIFPLFGLDSLKLGTSPPALIVLALSSAIAAIGYGIAIGNIANTYHQSSVFGAISIVIMAAIGGVWIPTFIMSEPMRKMGLFSPMHWGLSGFLDVFLQDAGIKAVLPESGIMLLFGLACFAIAVTFNYRRRLDV